MKVKFYVNGVKANRTNQLCLGNISKILLFWIDNDMCQMDTCVIFLLIIILLMLVEKNGMI